MHTARFRSLPLFVQHVESVRRAPESEKKVTVIDNALHIAIMSARGGCTSKAADKEFGPFVEFDARACETLVRVRKLSRNTPALQFNIATSGGQQVNLTK